MKKNIVIIHYNTPYLTECLVRSINFFVKDAIIYIFDNSDKDPFTAKFDNVTIFDNTKGFIVDFDKWLEKYPNRVRSGGKSNKWGSAKHCYSVEKCIEFIGENFILLDSDVLLKKDISNLFKDDIIYAGEIINQPKSTIKRVLPFLCYINVKMCKENNIHYFDENYMHGLCHNKINSRADSYDTGAGFYINTLKFKHEDINLDEYIVHYGHGSWNKTGYEAEYDDKTWVLINKRLWSPEINKKVVYTCITGNYDSLLKPKIISDGFDYICFTDNKDIKSDVWQILPLPKETSELSQVKKQRYVKINPHKLLEKYDISIWVDGNVEIIEDLNEFVNETIKNDISIYVPEHPSRKCIYSEEKAVLSLKKDVSENTSPQINRYKEENYPINNGLLQSNIMLRKHNNEDCIKVMEIWWEEVKNGSHRDQLSFNYASWKVPTTKIFYIDKKICDSKWFYWHKTHPKHTPVDKKPIQTQTQKRSSKSIEELKKNFQKILEEKRKLRTSDVGIYK